MAGSGLGEYGFAKQFASLAQSVEHAAVNRSVNGSSPLGSAILEIQHTIQCVFLFLSLLKEKLDDIYDAHYYIIGTGEFIKTMKTLLEENNINKDHYLVDNFG